jgi:tRNA wybutosine-synthesizing protein 2
MMENADEDPSEGPIGATNEQYTLSCSRRNAERIREIILEMNLFDAERSIGNDGSIHFPLKFRSSEDKKILMEKVQKFRDDIEITNDLTRTRPRDIDLKPFNRVVSSLEGKVPARLIELIPTNYERYGDCLVLRLPQELREFWFYIASSFSEVLLSRYVLNDIGGVSGEYREPDLEVLIPPDDGKFNIIHREGRSRYCFDPRRIMFSSGNTDERTRFPDVISSTTPPRLEEENGNKEVVVDMFAGIGYFTIPAALGDVDIEIIFAIEKNPISYRYLKKNIEINNIQDRVHPLHGDNREVLPDNIADRIIMGYVGGTTGYLHKAFELIREEGGIIHLHDTVEIEKGPVWLFEQASRYCKDHQKVELVSWRRVKSYAPRIDHLVLDIKVRSTS